VVYLGALLGAFTGAKLVYLAAEGWMFVDSPDRWLIWATGKTIVGRAARGLRRGGDREEIHGL
jgi:phosphatidylglycerol:prolipoprotein diacylglycerol transferase